MHGNKNYRLRGVSLVLPLLVNRRNLKYRRTGMEVPAAAPTPSSCSSVGSASLVGYEHGCLSTKCRSVYRQVRKANNLITQQTT